ncbi:MAG: glycosyltransferase family 1 protein [Ignavibacteriaceae bacterium]|nr:glycosyltransferase family 1 protein [Ignavibacteriaceae bacterium]
MKVAYFNGTMKKEHDGVTRVLYRLIDEIIRTKQIDPLFISAIVPPVEEQPVEMFHVPSFAFPGYKDYRVAVPGRIFFENKLNNFNPDLIHINSPCPLGYAAVKYGMAKNIPVVATYHTHFPSYAKYYNVKALEIFGWDYLRNLYNKCQTVYVPSLPILDELKNHGFETVEYLPHGVDTKLFNPSAKSDMWKSNFAIEGKFALLFAGRLVWEKGLRTLVDTYSVLSGQRTDIKFVLAGDGPLKDELISLMPDAIFLGQQPVNDLAVSFASSDIFVFPSTTETFGNVTLEAMASGLPPVCVKEGGAYGIIQNSKTGLIAKPRDPSDIADKINILLNNSDYKNTLSSNALLFAKTQSWENNFKKLFRSYESIVHNYNLRSVA